MNPSYSSRQRFFRMLLSLWIAIGATESTNATILPNGLIDSVIATGLANPTGVAPLPDGSFLVIEQFSGVLRRISPGATSETSPLNTPLLTLPDLNPDGNERGLLGVAIDPQFPERPFVYLYYTGKNGACNLVRYEMGLSGSSATINVHSGAPLIEDIPDSAWNHNGGCLRFGPKGELFVSCGEDAVPCAAQTAGVLHGRILRLNVAVLPLKLTATPTKSALAFSDNPFVSSGTADDSVIWALGLRNPFRFHIDAQTGDLFIADVGQLDYEEVDISHRVRGGGENFGWPFREGPSARIQPGCNEPGGLGAARYDQPIAWYDRSGNPASIISLCLYRSAPNAPYRWPKEYNGNYFYLDYYTGDVWRIAPDKSGRWPKAPSNTSPVAGAVTPTLWAKGLKSVADSFVGADGALYFVRQFDDEYNANSGSLHMIYLRNTIGSIRESETGK